MQKNLLSIERHKQKLIQLKKQIQIQENKLKTEKQKKKIHNLIELGKLVEKANINHLTSNELFGAFLEIKENCNSEEKKEFWTKKALKENAKTDCPLIITFMSDPTQQTKDLLKQLKFKWNSFRKEWYGHGDLEKLKTLLKNTSAKIEIT